MYPLIAPVVYPIAMISQTVSVYLTLTVTLERFVAVCHPLQARSLCTYGRARAYVVAIIAFAVLYNITRFWEVRVQACMHNDYGQHVYQVYPSELRNDKRYISVYIHWMYLVIMYFVPFGSLAVLNAAIYNQVRPDHNTTVQWRGYHRANRGSKPGVIPGLPFVRKNYKKKRTISIVFGRSNNLFSLALITILGVHFRIMSKKKENGKTMGAFFLASAQKF